MHNDQTIQFISALKDAVGKHWLSVAEPGMQQQMATCTQRILAQLVVNGKALPEIEQQALERFNASLNATKSVGKTLAAGNSYSDTESDLQAWIAHQASGLSDMDSDSAALLAAVIETEAKAKQSLLDTLTEALVDVAHEQSELVSPQQQVALQMFLRETFQSDVLKVSNIKAIPGGYSKHTLFVTVTDAPGVPETLVVRLDRGDSPRGSKVVNEYQVIKTLYERGVAVPEIFALEDSGDVLGGAFLLMSKIDGNSVGDALDVEAGSRELALDLATKLARLHQVPATAFSDDLPGAGITSAERMLGEINYFEQQWREFNFPSLSLELAFAWLKNNLELADGVRSLVHKDMGCHNMLVANEQVMGFLDWESACIGHPAEDLGYLQKTVEQMCDWQEFLQAYGAAGGVIPSREQQVYYELWGFTWLTVMIMIAGNVFTSGASQDIQLGYVGTYMKTRLEAQLANALKRIFSGA